MELDNPASQKLRDMIDSIRQERTRFLKVSFFVWIAVFISLYFKGRQELCF